MDDRNTRERVKMVFRLLEYSHNEHLKKTGELYEEIRKIRNNIAHAGYQSHHSHEEDIRNIPRYVRLAKELYFHQDSNRRLKTIPEQYPFSTLKLK
jgi:hypothetical protein